MEEDEKLPDFNPEQKCPKCEKFIPVWRLHLFLGENRKRLAHNFCPASTPDGGIINLCMKCKMEEVAEEWKKAERR